MGDRCEVSPRQIKCDVTGEVWGDRPVALAYLDVPGNAAKAHACLELHFPVEAAARESAPLHTADIATPLTPSHADSLLASFSRIACALTKPRATAGTPFASAYQPGCNAQVVHLTSYRRCVDGSRPSPSLSIAGLRRYFMSAGTQPRMQRTLTPPHP
eukprot:142727-Pleurochrysis_carterae.AAC.1